MSTIKKDDLAVNIGLGVMEADIRRDAIAGLLYNTRHHLSYFTIDCGGYVLAKLAQERFNRNQTVALEQLALMELLFPQWAVGQRLF